MMLWELRWGDLYPQKAHRYSSESWSLQNWLSNLQISLLASISCGYPMVREDFSWARKALFSLLKMEPRHLDSLMSQLPDGHWPNRHALFRANATGRTSCSSAYHWHHRISIWLGEHHLPVSPSPRHCSLRIFLFRGQVPRWVLDIQFLSPS